MSSPTARTLKFLRSAGHIAAVVEKWIPQTKQRLDLYGFIDVVAMHPDSQGLLGVQATSGAHHSERCNKILGIPAAVLWLRTGNRIWVVSWTKKGVKGKRKLWQPRIEPIDLSVFPGVETLTEVKG